MRTLLTLALATSLLATAASAGQEAAKPSQTYVDLQPIGFPAVVNGRLVNYIFATLRLNLAPGTDLSSIGAQEPVLRDSLVRDGARAPFNPPQDGVHLDQPRLSADVLNHARALYGPGKVLSVVIHSETPQRRMGVPGPRTP
jgi:hypothetical protein